LGPRFPTDAERSLSRVSSIADPNLAHLCLALLNANEFVYVE